MIAIPGGKTPVLSSSMMNNGVMGYYDIPAVYENKITIAYRGAGAGFVSYHPEKFNATLNCGILNEKFKLTPNIALYLCAIIRAVCLKKYNYKEIITPSRLLTEFIFLPSDSSGNPDWDYMENYIKELTTKTSKSIDLLSKVS